MLDIVVDRGVGREKTLLLPNGADLETFRKLPRENSIVNEYPFGDRFVVMYAGLFGIKHSLKFCWMLRTCYENRKILSSFLLAMGHAGMH